MDSSSLLRMGYFVKKYLTTAPTSVLDVGSYDVNGSYKHFFNASNFTYTGLDIEQGPNVDFVPKYPYQWSELEDNSFDVIISGQALEHIEFFWVTVGEMVRVLRPEGLICIIVPRGFVRHRYPVDCYRFDTDGMIAIARYFNLIPIHASTNLAPKDAPWDWYSEDEQHSILIAKKPADWNGNLNLSTYVFQTPDLKQLATGFVSCSIICRLTYLPIKRMVSLSRRMVSLSRVIVSKIKHKFCST